MDLVIRAAVIFFFIFLVTRIAGRRQLSELEPFDVILLVVLGDLVQQGITQSDESVTGTLIVISTVTLLSVSVGWLSFRFGRVRLITEGEPIILIHDGELVEPNLRRERLTRGDLEEEVRRQQLTTLDEVRWAILEDGGTISIIPKQ
ncbi:MAG TPA: YetF domain-containing protein [Solirubrobacteraceae bacterium]|nr:YetF domain-containing protein [Solirubrobacteraceae bacterium]